MGCSNKLQDEALFWTDCHKLTITCLEGGRSIVVFLLHLQLIVCQCFAESLGAPGSLGLVATGELSLYKEHHGSGSVVHFEYKVYPYSLLLVVLRC